MTDVTDSVKAQFAQVFSSADWHLFKKMAEANLREAARLLKKDVQIEKSLKLLARNSRKRLLIGVGVELLLKAVYLKLGYAINKAPNGSALRFPFFAVDAVGVALLKDKTVMLNDLIEKLPNVLTLRNKKATVDGLKIAQVFRNKEGHVVTRAHTFEPANYRDIASSLVDVYGEAFGEILRVQFSLSDEKAIWRVSPRKAARTSAS